MFGKRQSQKKTSRRLSSGTRERIKKRDKTEPNYQLILSIVFMLLAGLLMIFSASAVISYIYHGGDTFFFFKRQLIWIAVGLFFGGIVYLIPIARLRYLSVILLIAAFAMLIYLLPEALFGIDVPFVKTLNGATRWIDFGFFDLQPSEFMKLALLLFTCSWLTLTDASKKSIENFIERFKDKPFLHAMATIVYSVFPILIMGFAGFFIFFQNELDSVIVIFLTFTVVYYVAGTKAIHTYISGGLLALGGLIAALSLRTPYRLSRVQAFWQILVHGEPLGDSKRGDAFQVWNGLIALGSGGLFGVGYGNSRLKLFYLQEAAYTDSIFAIIGEEFGIFGTILVILGFLLFLSLGLNIAKNAETKFASLIAIGITAWVTIQAFLNIASNLALIPFGGLPLPFYSYGGSNTIMLLIACGILLNISRKPKL